ncbi:hypothetical protein EI94DRAFT_415558 [Lactarius quietus]|nr:hypothetical protein EI94DRAFT_415558 [Lactarius quietus]
MQGQVATTGDRRNFIVADGKNENFRFTKDVFEKRAQVIPRPGINDDDVLPADAETTVDDETERWPVPDNMHDKLDAIKYEYKAQPVPAYTMEDVFVEPAAVVDTIAGALVHVQFELVHYHISKRSHDSFNATVAQITVILPGAPPPTSSLKRKNVRNGPLRANPLLLSRKGRSSVDVPSTSNLNALVHEKTSRKNLRRKSSHRTKEKNVPTIKHSGTSLQLRSKGQGVFAGKNFLKQSILCLLSANYRRLF